MTACGPSPRDACTRLSRLLAEAERELARPAFRDADNAMFAEALADIHEAAHAPVESSDQRFIGPAADLLAQALHLGNRARGCSDDPVMVAMAQVVGVLMPVVRDDYRRALAARANRRATP